MPSRSSRWRKQGGARRAWFDGRDYRDVGGKLESLIAAGERFATTNPDVATRLASGTDLDVTPRARYQRRKVEPHGTELLHDLRRDEGKQVRA